MGKLLCMAVFVFLPLFCAAPALAQTVNAHDEEAKAKLLTRITDDPPRNAEGQRRTYRLGKEYLRRSGDRSLDETDAQTAAYIRHWVAKYELAERKFYHSLRLPSAAPRGVCRRRRH